LGDSSILKGYVIFLKKVFPTAEITLMTTLYEQFNIHSVEIKKHPFVINRYLPRPLILFQVVYSVYLRLILYSFFKNRNNQGHFDIVIFAQANAIKAEGELLDSFYHLLTVVLAKLTFKAPLIVGPTSVIGSFRSRTLKFLIRSVYNRTDAILLRDFRSKDIVLGIGIKPEKIHYFPDLSFLIPPSKLPDYILNEEGLPKDLPLVAVIPNMIMSNRSVVGTCKRFKYNDYVVMIAQFVDWLIQSKQCRVLLVPFQVFRKQEDEKICRDIAEHIEQKAFVFSVCGRYEPEEMKGLFSLCSLVFTSRLHPGLFAVSVGTPVIMLVPDSRASRILDEAQNCGCSIITIDNVSIRSTQILLEYLKKRTNTLWGRSFLNCDTSSKFQQGADIFLKLSHLYNCKNE
jgi:polysaccharide pyruvyl transferase WcaK-like protein